MNDRLSIDTPENIILNAEIAGFGTRCIAAIIDYLILLVFILFASNLYWQSIPVAARTQGTALAVLSPDPVCDYHILSFVPGTVLEWTNHRQADCWDARRSGEWAAADRQRRDYPQSGAAVRLSADLLRHRADHHVRFEPDTAARRYGGTNSRDSRAASGDDFRPSKKIITSPTTSSA